MTYVVQPNENHNSSNIDEHLLKTDVQKQVPKILYKQWSNFQFYLTGKSSSTNVKFVWE